MKKLLLCFLLFPFFVNGQTWEWAHGVGNNHEYNNASGVASDAHGNVYITGDFESTIVFGTDTLICPFTGYNHNAIFLVKYDAMGNVLWARSSMGNYYGNDNANALATDPSGNVYIVGSFFSRQLIFGNDTLTTDSVLNERSIFVVKYDSLGNALWARSALATDATFQESWAEATGVTTDIDGNVYITGDFQSPWIIFGTDTLKNMTSVAGMDVFVTKYNSDGNVLWARQSTYGSSVNAYASKVAVDLVGNVYIAGNYYGTRLLFGNDTIKNIAWERPFFVKYDALGNIQWVKSTTKNDPCIISSVATDLTGNVIIAGEFNDTLILNEDTLINTGPSGNWFVAKYNSLGNVMWMEHFDAVGEAFSVVTDESSNIYVAGLHEDSLITPAGNNFEVVKYSSDGTIIWSVFPNYGFPHPVCIAKDRSANNLYVAGVYSDSVQLGIASLDSAVYVGTENIFLAKLAILPPTGILTLSRIYEDVFVYPNPATTQLIIQSANEPITNITISNIIGQSLKSIIYSSQFKVAIDISGLSSGVYLVKVNNIVKKFIKE